MSFIALHDNFVVSFELFTNIPCLHCIIFKISELNMK